MWIATKRSEHSENAEGRVCQVIGFRWSGSGQDEGKDRMIMFGGVFFPSDRRLDYDECPVPFLVPSPRSRKFDYFLAL